MQETTMKAVILAGGQSSRMGTPKELLRWRGGTILSELIKEVRALGLECLVVSNTPERLKRKTSSHPRCKSHLTWFRQPVPSAAS